MQKILIGVIIILCLIIIYKKYITLELYQPLEWKISDAKLTNWPPYWLTTEDTNFPIVPGVSKYNYDCANPFNTSKPVDIN